VLATGAAAGAGAGADTDTDDCPDEYEELDDEAA